MSEFKDAIAWRGPSQLAFIVYGIWERGEIDGQLDEVAKGLESIVPGARISPFVASDDDWPCEVGVFDVELSSWPDAPERFCEALLATICLRGAWLSWMMFDGAFNQLSDIFSADWAPQVYAIKRDCGIDEARSAIADHTRHSTDWREFVLDCRRMFIAKYSTMNA